jgi:hypothetical protein
LKNIPVAVLVGSKVHTMVVISNSVLVVVCWGNISVDWGRSISWGWGIDWGRGILRSSRGNSQKSRQSNKALQQKVFIKKVLIVNNS